MKYIDPKLLKILVCPITKEPLFYNKKNTELISINTKLTFKIINEIPIMLIDKAKSIKIQ